MTAMPVVTLDGPNGVGKTAVARELAGRLGWSWLSIGTVYRALAAARVDPARVPPLRITAEPAADGVLDPLVHVGAAAYREPELAGPDLAAAAASLGADPGLQAMVGAVLAGMRAPGLVAEGRATRQIFPGAVASVYLWADIRERERRTAALSGGVLDLDRERRDRVRAGEPLRVRPGCVVWNSTRAELNETVGRLHRRIRILQGVEEFTLAVADPESAPWLWRAGTRLVPIDEADPETVVDAVAVLPTGIESADVHACLAAHAEALRRGNDMVSVGTFTRDGRPDLSLAASVPWPANRYLTPDWLFAHGHFAVGADVFARDEGESRGHERIRRLCVALGKGKTGSIATADRAALASATWVPNAAALLPTPAERLPRRIAGRLPELLHALQDGSGPGPRVRATVPSADPHAVRSILAAAPESMVWFDFEEA